jgi:hypothetical protein
MQRCKVIPPTRQNRSHIARFNFRTSSIEDATNDKYGDRVGENYEGPSTILAQQYQSRYPLLPAQDCTHGRQWQHATVNVPSPRQFNVTRQSVGCICPEKILQSMTMARIEPYLEYPDR